MILIRRRALSFGIEGGAISGYLFFVQFELSIHYVQSNKSVMTL